MKELVNFQNNYTVEIVFLSTAQPRNQMALVFIGMCFNE
jgi:hypothetical protein